MSALNVFAGRTQADIWTDGAHMTPDGVVRKISSKAFVLGGLPAVLAVAGPSDLGILAHLALFDRFTAYDDLVDGAVDALRERPEFGDPARGCIIVLAGWSTRHGEVRTHVMSTNGEIPGLPAWAFPEAWRWLMPNPPSLMPDLTARGIDVTALDHMSDYRALTILRTQRALRLDMPQAKGINPVGGFAQCTTITRVGVHTRIVERWPDIVGERIAA